jgi:ADP-ribosylglycohydrolase
VDGTDISRRILKEPIKGWPGWEEFKTAALAKKRAMRTGNGSAARVAPIGIIHPPDRLKELVKDVDRACGITHNTRSALSAGCAIAAAFSAAIEGWRADEIIDHAIKAAEQGRELGQDDLAPDVARRLRWLKKEIRNRGVSILDLRVRGLNPGFQAWEGATFALALVMLYDSAKEAILCAVNMGGDSDSIAAMAGGIIAARFPETLPRKWIETVKRMNKLHLEELAKELVALRSSEFSFR